MKGKKSENGNNQNIEMHICPKIRVKIPGICVVEDCERL